MQLRSSAGRSKLKASLKRMRQVTLEKVFQTLNCFKQYMFEVVFSNYLGEVVAKPPMCDT